MNKVVFAIFLMVFIVGCADNTKRPLLPQIWDEPYVTNKKAVQWSKTADIKLLCFGLKNYKSKNIRNACEDELFKRGIDTKTCYQFKDYDLSETFD